jgi:hypothetical protein
MINWYNVENFFNFPLDWVGHWVSRFQNCFQQHCHPPKMVAVTKSRTNVTGKQKYVNVNAAAV